MATRPRSGSRLSRLSRYNASNTEWSDTEELHASARSPHSTLRSRADLSTLRPSLASSSSQQKTPARSYYHRSIHGSLGSIDISQDTSKEVREDTAELASWALSDKSSFAHGHSPRETLHSPTSLSNNDARSDAQNPSDHCRSEDAPYPDVIPEISEPVSPSSLPSSHKSPGVSALSEMFKSTPQTRVENLSTEDDEGSIDGSGTDAVTVQDGIISQPTEQTALLLRKQAQGSKAKNKHSYLGDLESQRNSQATNTPGRFRDFLKATAGHGRMALSKFLHPKSWEIKVIWDQGLKKPASYIPPVILGLLLNILDALSYGMILFPLGQPIFANLGVDGISMFYVSCIISQLVYSLGGSVFRGGIGSEMIEVVPFFHKMAFIILAKVGDAKPEVVLTTTILSFSTSAVLTGAVFFIMGFCKLGALIGFFPRLEVSARLDGNLDYNLVTLKKLFQADTIALWTIPLFLAICLTLIKRRVKYSFVDAAYFLSIIGIFYFFVGAIDKLELPDLRSKGWVFRAPDAAVPFYHFYTLYDFEAVDWAALADTIPTMLALTFFGIIHVPINVPALAFTLGEDNVDVDRELKAHGLSNAFSGLCGSVQNYLVYTNSVLFVRSGGDSRVAGVMLAAATFGVLLSGPIIIRYIPIMVVGALIFFLGIDLMMEALVVPWGKLHRLEYLTILIIVVTMGAWDFVVGILIGILLACVSFVLQTSRVSAIRNSLPGSIAASTVRRHPIQHRFLQEAGKQIYVMKLAGYLFFGTIVGVEKQIRALLLEKFEREPIRFLILDLQNVVGIDFSAAEAFTRIKRLLDVRSVTLIIAGISMKGEMGTALWNIGLFNAEDPVQYFETINSALEHCENDLLVSLYQHKGVLAKPDYSPTFLNIPKHDGPKLSSEIIYSSPRRKELQHVATTAYHEQDHIPHSQWQDYKQPLQLLLLTFSTVSEKPEEFWYRAVPFFERIRFANGSILYKREEMADGFFLLESGMLKAEYMLPQLGKFSELIVEGTTCGELPFFSGTKRTSTTSAERDCVTWMLNQSRWEELQRRQPDIAQELLKISLKLTSERMDAITK
ncbi:MAG: hypothetical protein Q9209_003363 [Squamulea sp. 1 TL-2023]